MRVLVAAMGSRGDVQPALALTRALRQAGHDAVLSAPPDFAGWAAELDLPFFPAGTRMEEILQRNAAAMGGNPVKLVRALREIVTQEMPKMMQGLLEAAEGAGAIVAANQFLARTVAEIHGIPLIGVCYQPTLIPSAHHPPLIGRWQTAPRWINRLRWAVAEKLGTSIFLEPINRERVRVGLAPATSYQDHIFGGVPLLVACDPVIAPAPPDWDRFDVEVTGPWFYEDASPLAQDVVDFIEAGAPPVYVGFGSMPNADPAAATRVVLDGIAASGHRLLLSKGWAGLGVGPGSPSVKVVAGPVPHSKLFPRLAAVVHHGGAGTLATALRAGVPQVLVPHAFDQHYYAHRLQRLGIAPKGIPMGGLTASKLARAIGATLALPPAPRLEVAERLRPGGGLRRAVERIDALAGSPEGRVTGRRSRTPA